VTDAVEALGQHVQQKAPDELVRVKPHNVAGNLLCLVSKSDLICKIAGSQR